MSKYYPQQFGLEIKIEDLSHMSDRSMHPVYLINVYKQSFSVWKNSVSINA